MTQLDIVILNEYGPKQHSESREDLESWRGFDSLVIAETLRSLMLPFKGVNDVQVRISRDYERAILLHEYPSAHYMIWEVRGKAHGMPVVIGHVMVRRGYAESQSRCALRYTPSGAKKVRELRTKATSP